MKITVDGGFEIEMPEPGDMRVTRFGRKWRSLIGDTLVYHMAHDLQTARAKIEELENQIRDMSADTPTP